MQCSRCCTGPGWQAARETKLSWTMSSRTLTRLAEGCEIASILICSHWTGLNRPAWNIWRGITFWSSQLLARTTDLPSTPCPPTKGQLRATPPRTLIYAHAWKVKGGAGLSATAVNYWLVNIIIITNALTLDDYLPCNRDKLEFLNGVDEGTPTVPVSGRVARCGRCRWRQQRRKAWPHEEEKVPRAAKYRHLRRGWCEC